MYGVEAQSSGGGGLAARTPYQDPYFGQAIGIQNPTIPLIGAPPTNESLLPDQSLGRMAATPYIGPATNGSGTAATVPPAQMQPTWRSVLDFHNSPAPWILIGLLLLFGWLHISVSARGGRQARAGLSV